MQVISGAVLAAYIGGGGLGDFITAGIAMMALPQLLVGAIPATLLALGTDRLFGALQRAMTPARPATLMIEIVALTKRFPAPRIRRSTGSTLTVAGGRGLRAHRPFRLREDDDDAHHQPDDRARRRDGHRQRPQRDGRRSGHAARGISAT